MKERLIIGAITMLLVIGLLCFVAWMGGYNFDHRDEKVGILTFWGICFAGICGIAAGLIPKGE